MECLPAKGQTPCPRLDRCAVTVVGHGVGGGFGVARKGPAWLEMVEAGRKKAGCLGDP